MATKANTAEKPDDPALTLSLTEFCTRLSETVKRPELIGAFEFRERNAKRNKATEAEFRARFDAFINTPV
jgi:hypothetical protein